MRKVVYATVAIALGAAAITSSAALAKSSNAALRVHDTECEVFDGNGNTAFIPWHEVVNNDTDELICTGRVPNDTGGGRSTSTRTTLAALSTNAQQAP
jgi:hypothetical protein